MKRREDGHGDPKPQMPPSFHLIAIVITIIPAESRVGSAIATLPKWLNNEASRTTPTRTQTPPPNDRRICRSSLVITSSTRN
jgi:hypothetical protein